MSNLLIRSRPRPDACARIMVGVPVYRGQDFVEETLDSIRAQQFADIRVLISVDGDDDDSYGVCQRCLLGDRRFQLVRQPRRLGWPGNFNWLLGQLDEEFFCYWQQDDLCDPSYFRVLVDHADRHREAACVYSDIQHFGGKKSRLTSDSVTGAPLDRVLQQIEMNRSVALRGIIRREAILAAGPVPEGLKQELVWMAAIARAGEVHRIPQALYHRRVWPGSYSANTRNLLPSRQREVTVEWAVGMLGVALPLVQPPERTRLMALIVDRMVIPRQGRLLYFQPKDNGGRIALVAEFLRQAHRRHRVLPFSELHGRADLCQLLRAKVNEPDKPAEALMARAVLANPGLLASRADASSD